MSMAYNGEDVVTGAADETLRFWHVFDYKNYNNN